MSNEKFDRELRYRTSVFIAQSLLKNGIISKEEFNEIDTILLEKYSPVIGAIFSENT